jgi:hypothetical protein
MKSDRKEVQAMKNFGRGLCRSIGSSNCVLSGSDK